MIIKRDCLNVSLNRSEMEEAALQYLQYKGVIDKKTPYSVDLEQTSENWYEVTLS